MSKLIWLTLYIGLLVLLVVVNTHSCQLPKIEDPAGYFGLR